MGAVTDSGNRVKIIFQLNLRVSAGTPTWPRGTGVFDARVRLRRATARRGTADSSSESNFEELLLGALHMREVAHGFLVRPALLPRLTQSTRRCFARPDSRHSRLQRGERFHVVFDDTLPGQPQSVIGLQARPQFRAGGKFSPFDPHPAAPPSPVPTREGQRQPQGGVRRDAALFQDDFIGAAWRDVHRPRLRVLREFARLHKFFAENFARRNRRPFAGAGVHAFTSVLAQ